MAKRGNPHSLLVTCWAFRYTKNIPHMSTPKPEELEIEDPTPMMEVWRKAADEFGIPFQTQKGLMFLTAFGLRVSYQADSVEEWIGFTQKLSSKIADSAPHIPEDEGVAYSRGDISVLLTEFAKRFLGEEFTPRSYVPASQRAGQTFEIEAKPYKVLDAGWAWEGNSMLPDCLCEETWWMSDWDDVMTSLCAQIGKAINMNLEGAYLAGFVYFERQYRADQEASLQIAQLVSGMMPPKFMWFRHMLNFDADIAGQGNPMAKTLDCFLRGIPDEAPLLYRMVTFLSDQLHYEAPGKRKQSMWDASLIQFSSVVSQQRNWFSSNAVAYWSDFGTQPPEGYASDHQDVPSLIEYLQEKEWLAPALCSSLEEAVGTVAAQIEARWGYRIFDDTEALTPADNWTRRACILHACVSNSVLNPEWNKFDTEGN